MIYSPTPYEVGARISRVLRFNGQTIVPYSVLQHTLAGYEILRKRSKDPYERVVWLLHDSEEGWVGDTPKPFKTDEQKLLGDSVREEIFHYNKVPYQDPRDITVLAQLDNDMADAEANIICFPKYRERFPDMLGTPEIEAVTGLLDIGAREAIDIYVEILTGHLESPQLKSLRGRV